jgi:hypothetical protein
MQLGKVVSLCFGDGKMSEGKLKAVVAEIFPIRDGFSKTHNSQNTARRKIFFALFDEAKKEIYKANQLGDYDLISTIEKWFGAEP